MLPFLLEDADLPSPATSQAATGSAPLPAFQPASGIAPRSSRGAGSTVSLRNATSKASQCPAGTSDSHQSKPRQRPVRAARVPPSSWTPTERLQPCPRNPSPRVSPLQAQPAATETLPVPRRGRPPAVPIPAGSRGISNQTQSTGGMGKFPEFHIRWSFLLFFFSFPPFPPQTETCIQTPGRC